MNCYPCFPTNPYSWPLLATLLYNTLAYLQMCNIECSHCVEIDTDYIRQIDPNCKNWYTDGVCSMAFDLLHAQVIVTLVWFILAIIVCVWLLLIFSKIGYGLCSN